MLSSTEHMHLDIGPSGGRPLCGDGTSAGAQVGEVEGVHSEAVSETVSGREDPARGWRGGSSL